MIVIRV